VARHEPLRTAFHAVGDEIRQVVREPYCIHLSAEPIRSEDPESAVRHAIADAFGEPIDLTDGRLLRAHLFRCAEDDHVLLLIVHHIANDAWSMTVLHEELAEFYAGRLAGNAPALEPLQIQYADFAQWQLSQQRQDSLEADAHFWRGYLSGVPHVL